MRFSVYKHPKLNFWALIGVFSVLAFLTVAGAALFLTRVEEDFGLWIGFFAFLLLFFLLPLIFVFCLKADFFAEFSFDCEGITVYHQKKGIHKILWTEIVDSGIIEKHYDAEPLYYPRFVYFSKRKLLKKDRIQLKRCAGADFLCADCRDEILFAVQEFFPISLEVKRVDVPRHPTPEDLEE